MPEPGEWFTWGTRSDWFRFVEHDDDALLYDAVGFSNGDPTHYEEGDYGDYILDDEFFISLPPDSPNLPDHIRTQPPLVETTTPGRLVFQAERFGQQMDRVRAAIAQMTPAQDWEVEGPF